MATTITTSIINSHYKEFMKQRGSIENRYASFDLCYLYFYTNRGKLSGSKMSESCMQLWAFLGSWGMIARGNALQEKSYAYLKEVIRFINKNPQYYNSSIDDPTYCDDMLRLYKGLKKALNLPQRSQKTVITKIMLGVYGCLPAFDTYVCNSLGTSTIGDLTKKNVNSIINIYNSNKKLIDSLSSCSSVRDFSDSPTKEHYTPAKIIDMILFTR